MEAAGYMLSGAENTVASRYLWGENAESDFEQLFDRLDGVLVILRSAVDPDSLRRQRDHLGWGVTDLAKHWIGDELLYGQDDMWWKHPVFSQILELNVIVLSPALIDTDVPHPTHSCHLSSFTNSFLWLPTYLEALALTVGSTSMMDATEQTSDLWNTIANVFLLMSSSSFSFDPADVVTDGGYGVSLINAVRWAISAVTTQEWKEEPGVKVSSLYRLQSATLCLFHSPIFTSLTSTAHPQEDLLYDDILNLLNQICVQGAHRFLSQYSAHLSWQDHPDIARARTAVDVIQGLLRVEDGRTLDDLQVDEEWSADPVSDPLLLIWIQIVCSSLFNTTAHGSLPPSPEIISLFPTNMLLHCKIFLQPTEAWLAALPKDTISRHDVSTLGIAAAWSGWDTWEKSTDRSMQNRTTLIDHTIQLLYSMPETGWEDVSWLLSGRIGWYIQDMLRISGFKGNEEDSEERSDEMQRALKAARDKVPIPSDW